ncbi:MAG: anhydro-N-acetylmuramic acid kinase, partial [Betaproteobacteria bacterium]
MDHKTSFVRTGLYAGVMSGTSLDGLDAVLVDIGSEGPPRLVAAVHQAFAPDLQTRLQHLAEGAPAGAAELGAADVAVADAYADILLALLLHAGVSADDVVAAGCHGPTEHHAAAAGRACSMQRGAPNPNAVRS